MANKKDFEIKQTVRPAGKYRAPKTKTKIEFPKAQDAANKQADVNRRVNDEINFKNRQSSGPGKGDTTRPTDKSKYNKNYDDIDWGESKNNKNKNLEIKKGQKTIIQYGNKGKILQKYSNKKGKPERVKTTAYYPHSKEWQQSARDQGFTK